jgi:transposase
MTDETPQRHAGGRPTKYDPAYCDMAVEYMAQGYSMTAFAGSIRVSRSTINEWMANYPEFSEAIKVGKPARTSKLETDLLSAESGPVVTSRIFALKNACPEEWVEKTAVALSNPDGSNLTLSDREIAQRIAFALAKGANQPTSTDIEASNQAKD